MKAHEFKWLQTHCSFEACEYEGESLILISPYSHKDQNKLCDILYRQEWSHIFPTIKEFNRAVEAVQPEYQHLRKAEQLKAQQTADLLMRVNSGTLAGLPVEQKISLLDHLLLDVYHSQDWENADLNHKHIRETHPKLEVLLFNMKLPAEFMQEETYKAKQFCNRLQFIPDLKQKLESWPELTDEKRQEVMLATADIFAKTYHLPELELQFFDDEGYKQRFPKEDWSNPDLLPPTGYALSPTIYINTDRIRICDNYMPVNMIFHEALHITQQEQDFSRFPMMEKFFEPKFSHLGIDSSVSDVYLMSPVERHAYGLEFLIKEHLQTGLKIKYLENSYRADKRKIISKVTEKAKILAAYQNRSY